MPVSVARKGVWAIVLVGILLILAIAALPLVASTQIVRDSIAHQMSLWSGYRVRLDDKPQIRVWPSFQAVLNDVTFLDWNNTNPHTVIEAEQIEMDLSALAALRGEVVFTRMRLVRPILRLGQDGETLHLPAPQNWGRLARSVNTARQAIAAAPNQPDTTALPGDAFGVVKFVEGRVVAGTDDSQVDIVTSLSGTLDWPALNRQAALTATGIWHGESVSLTALSAEPLILLGGGNAAVDIALQAAPANLTFKGKASLLDANFVDGYLNLSAPSLRRLVEWTHARPIVANRVGPVSLSSRLVGDPRRLKFEETTLTLDNSTGKGLLDVTIGSGRPMIAGTLAFDRLNLRALFNAFNPLSPVASGQPGQMQAGHGGFDFDLRFSAADASFDGATLTNVAAAAKMRGGHAAFDVSDATAFDGHVQFGLRADGTGSENLVEISIVGENIDAGKLAAAFGHQRLVPQARGTFSLMLRGAGQDFETVLQGANGSISANFGRGTIPGLSLDVFLERSAAGSFFPVAALDNGALPLDGAELKVSVAKGVAQIETAQMRSGPYLIGIDGLAPLAGRGLALYGTLSAPEGTDQRFRSPLTFFVGGSWSAPFIASFLPQVPAAPTSAE